jgi:hypothetical protein
VDQGSTEHCAKQTNQRCKDQANHTGTARHPKLAQGYGCGQNEEHASDQANPGSPADVSAVRGVVPRAAGPDRQYSSKEGPYQGQSVAVVDHCVCEEEQSTNKAERQ